MPPIIRGEWTPSSLSEVTGKFQGKDFGYNYPGDLDLRPGSQLHDNIVSKVMLLARDSYDIFSKRHAAWKDIDQTMSAYIPLSDYEKQLKAKDPTRPVSIVVPYSYAVLEAALSYNTKAFFGREGIFTYDGMGPEDTIPAKLLEMVVNQQARYFKSALDMHTGFRDGYCYGFHASAVVWTKKYGKRPVSQTQTMYSTAGTPIGQQTTKTNVRTLLFEGNEVIPIDPYRCLPDPNVSAHKVHKGEFFGWFEIDNLQTLLTEEVDPNTIYFNAKYLREMAGASKISSIFNVTTNNRSKEGVSPLLTLTTNECVILTMYVKIIPAEWRLPGDPETNKDGLIPEIWMFTIGNDSILMSCAPLGLNHDTFPIAVNSPDFDGYSISPISRMEFDSGLQTVLNFLFNSHITNVRKAINDMFIVDPALVSMKDLQNPEPGKLIRLRKSAWGKGVKDAVAQLGVNDITRLNIQDAAFVMDLMQKVGASTDAVMGVQRKGGPDRVTAAEFSSTFGSAISRLERLATVTSLQYMQDLGMLHASHTQQLMSQETYVRAIGDWPKVLMDEYGQGGMMPETVKVDPFGILTSYDVIVKDNTSSSADATSMAFWQQALPSILQQPLLFNVLEIPQIFKHVARLAGEKNVNDFVKKGGDVAAQMVGDAALQKEVAAGNMVPMDKMMELMAPQSMPAGE